MMLRKVCAAGVFILLAAACAEVRIVHHCRSAAPNPGVILETVSADTGEGSTVHLDQCPSYAPLETKDK
jgi:hypothetical protein